ncbi:hypothetical protein XELAEV_18023477mg [Xenopus laevis]|nr:hypothetical protein XELAEV_18023477mg [Xenopus laevis]
MLFYDAATKKMRIPKKLMESNNILKQHFKGILHHAKQLSLPNSHEDEEQHFDAEIILTKQMITEMNRIIKDEEWNPTIMEAFLKNIVFRMKYHDKHNWEIKFEDIFFMDFEHAFMVVVFMLTAIGVLDLWTRVSWLAQLTCVLFPVVYVLQTIYDYEIIFTIKKKDSEQPGTESDNFVVILTIGGLLMLYAPWVVWFVKHKICQWHIPRAGEGNEAELRRNEEHIPMGVEGNNADLPIDPALIPNESPICLSVQETHEQYSQSDVQVAKHKVTNHSLFRNSDGENTELYSEFAKCAVKTLKVEGKTSTLPPTTYEESNITADSSLQVNTMNTILFQELLFEGVDQSVQNDRSLLVSNEYTSSETPPDESPSFVVIPDQAECLEASQSDDGPSVIFELM